MLKSGYNFYETWEGVESTCPRCGWGVSLSRSHTIHENDRIEFLCRNCREILTAVWHPTQAQAVGFGDRLSMMMFECLEAHEKGSEGECDLKIWMEGGFCAPKIEDSMLGLDRSSFVTRNFPEPPQDTSFRSPPEFVSYALSTLDAYSTAILAAHVSELRRSPFQLQPQAKRRRFSIAAGVRDHARTGKDYAGNSHAGVA